MKKQFRFIMYIVVIILSLQLIGCNKLNAAASEGIQTASNIINEKKSFTEKIAEILFGEEEPTPPKTFVKDYEFPPKLKTALDNAIYASYDITDEDLFYHVRDLYAAYQNGTIPFNGGMDFLVFSGYISSQLENYEIFTGPDFADWLGIPMQVEGYYRETYDYDFDEELVWIEGYDSFDYYIRIPLGDSAKWKRGDRMMCIAQFTEILYDEDRSAGYTQYIVGGVNLMGQYNFNLDKDIIKDYKMTPEEKEFYFNTKYVIANEQLELNEETGEMEKVYYTDETTITETELGGFPYTVKSVTKIGPDIEILFRLNDTHYDYNLYDKLIFHIDGTVEYMYSYLDINQNYTKETPADYYIFGWRWSNIF